MPNIIQGYVRIIAVMQAFSSQEIIEMIDPADMQKIKAGDPHPFFKAWVLAHEGESSPRFAGDSNQVKITWPRSAIQSMQNFIKKGIKFFTGHNRDNSTEGRPSLGEIVASKEMEIDGRLSSVVVGYFPPESAGEAKKMDVCSFEAVWDLIKTGAGVVADKLRELTGVALGNSAKDKPAFDGARELASVQAFEDNKDKTEGENKMSEITFHDVESYVKKNRVFPSQLFDWGQITADRFFIPEIKAFEEKIKTAEDALDGVTKEKEKLLTEKKAADDLLLRTTAKSRIEGIIKDKPEKLRKVILKKVEKWEDFSDDAVKANIAAVEEDYNDLVAAVPDGTTVPDSTKSKTENQAAEKTAAGNPALNFDAT